MHPNNLHRSGYDFDKLMLHNEKLAAFVTINEHGNKTIDFAKPEAVKALNKALLICYYGLKSWDIPKGYLCPPIPGRADYIHHLADFLSSQKIGTQVRVLDIGVGANGVYPIIGSAVYRWQFVGSDIDINALKAFQTTIDYNPTLKDMVTLRKQEQPEHIFIGVVEANDLFDICICNPPFHSSAEEAQKGTMRKWKNLGKGHSKPLLNFGGQSNELWCEGGELRFLRTMVQESKLFAHQFKWFSTLVSKHDNIAPLIRSLKSMNAKDIQTIEMQQGQKTSRMLIWRY